MTSLNDLKIPRAIYLDANPLIALPPDLVSQDFDRLRQQASDIGAQVLVPEVALEEWVIRRANEAIKAMSRMGNAAASVGRLLGCADPDFERIEHETLRVRVREKLLATLSDMGITSVPTPAIDVRDLCLKCINRLPPFAESDKGFKDAVILETILQHAAEYHKGCHIMVVTGDAAFTDSRIEASFDEAGVALHVAQSSPQTVVGEAVKMMQAMVRGAGLALFAEESRRIEEFVKRHEKDVLAYVEASAQVTMPWLHGIWRSRRDDEHENLTNRTIERIDAVRLIGVESAHRAVKETDDTTRVPCTIRVSVEVDVTTSTHNPFAGPSVVLSDAAQLVRLNREHLMGVRDRQTEKLTLRRRVHVDASLVLDSDGAYERLEYGSTY